MAPKFPSVHFPISSNGSDSTLPFALDCCPSPAISTTSPAESRDRPQLLLAGVTNRLHTRQQVLTLSPPRDPTGTPRRGTPVAVCPFDRSIVSRAPVDDGITSRWRLIVCVAAGFRPPQGLLRRSGCNGWDLDSDADQRQQHCAPADVSCARDLP